MVLDQNAVTAAELQSQRVGLTGLRPWRPSPPPKAGLAVKWLGQAGGAPGGSAKPSTLLPPGTEGNACKG